MNLIHLVLIFFVNNHQDHCANVRYHSELPSVLYLHEAYTVNVIRQICWVYCGLFYFLSRVVGDLKSGHKSQKELDAKTDWLTYHQL